MLIKLTENAVREIKQIVSAQEMDMDKTFVRIGIQSMNCSGPSYAFGFDEETDERDVVLEQDSIKIVYDKEYSDLLSNITIDYATLEDASGFVFNNPLKVLKSSSNSGGKCCGGGSCSS
jgi:iron-sulfur cluster assembly accessory protein